MTFNNDNNSQNSTCNCANNYTQTTFMEAFGKDDNEMRKCGNCPNFNYDNGICNCQLFNK